MSPSTTATATITTRDAPQVGDVSSLRGVLHAYDLHHSGTEDNRPTELLNGQLPTQPSIRIPSLQPAQQRAGDSLSLGSDPNAVSTRRRVPPYRETSRNHSLSSRPAGQDAISEVIVPAMFFGVFIQQVGNIFAYLNV